MNNIKPNSFSAWMACARPKTWALTISPVAVGLAVAFFESNFIDLPVAAATLLLSVLMQVISNMENDAGYTKKKAERGNRKGLPRSTSLGWLTVTQVESMIKILIGVVILDTCYLIYCGGWVMACISFCSVLAAYCYMGGPKPIAYTPFGELTVFLFFGIVAICGTYYLQLGTVSVLCFLSACSIGFISSAVLAVNNFRDIDHDRSVGRKTLGVILGRDNMIRVYAGILFASYASIALMIYLNHNIWPILIVILTLPKTVQLIKTIRKLTGNELNATMFGTVKLEVMSAFLLTLGSCVGAFLQNIH